MINVLVFVIGLVAGGAIYLAWFWRRMAIANGELVDESQDWKSQAKPITRLDGLPPDFSGWNADLIPTEPKTRLH